MIGLGSIVNAAAIAAGGCIGLVAGKAISERVRTTLVSGMAVGTLFVGASSTFSKMLSVGDGDVQELCDALWSVTSEAGTASAADMPKALSVVFAREKNGFENAIADLTPNQLTVLRTLAQMSPVRVFTSEFMDHARISSPGAIKRALNRIVASRLVYQNRTEYKFSNPFFREWLKVNA